MRSYRISRGTVSPPCLRIFLTNKFVYKEAAPVFYRKNVFTFPSNGCEVTLNACSAFLSDRPEHALSYIKNISLGIGFVRPNPLMECALFCGAHRPTVRRLGDNLRHLVHLNHLGLLIEEQYPTNELLNHLGLLVEEKYPTNELLKAKESLGYVTVYKLMEDLRGIKAPQTLEIEFIDSKSSSDDDQVLLRFSVSYMTGILSQGDPNYIISSPNAHNARGRAIFSTRIVYQRQAEDE